MTVINVLRGKMLSFCDVAACLQFPATRSYPEPDERSPHHFTMFLYFILHKICLMVIYLLDFWLELYVHFSALSCLRENCYETRRYFLPILGDSMCHVVGNPSRNFSRTVPRSLLFCLRVQCFSFAMIFLLSKPVIEQWNYVTCKQWNVWMRINFNDSFYPLHTLPLTWLVSTSFNYNSVLLN
jgi:hypothetical protein